jgi:hypothetical protein
MCFVDASIDAASEETQHPDPPWKSLQWWLDAKYPPTPLEVANFQRHPWSSMRLQVMLPLPMELLASLLRRFNAFIVTSA